MKMSLRQRVMLFVRRFGFFYLIDILIWSGAVIAAQLLRFDFDFSGLNFPGTFLLLTILAICILPTGAVTGLYRSRFQTGSFDEVRAIFVTTLILMIIGLVPTVVAPNIFQVPRGTLIIAAPISFSLMGLSRYFYRAYVESRLRPTLNAERTIIYGAGYAGTYTVQRLLLDKSAGLKPIGMIDDDPEKRNFSVRGIRVLGSLQDLRVIAQKSGASTLLVCIGKADSALMTKIRDIATECNLKVLVLPTFSEIIQDPSQLRNFRELTVEDLIGRHPVQLELDSIARYIRGSKVLVTGAGGSIGSELCRQLHRFEPAELIMLDRDETSLQEVQIQLHGHGLLNSPDVVLADIRDLDALMRIFTQRRPNVVFHAAALKHVPMLEQFPEEAWKTNVLGTQNVLDAAQSVGVETFVNISTDKAASPTSVLGHSKRVAEKITAAMGETTSKRYLSVRFGNVIGSRGSMLPTFQALIEAGGPLTVTDPDVTRFFMTIPEACQLVIQAGGVGRAGEVLILDMGEPVRILDVAERMIEQSGKQIEIVFTGLRQGEKLHEDLFSSEETASRPFHQKISHASVRPLRKENLRFDEWFSRLSR